MPEKFTEIEAPAWMLSLFKAIDTLDLSDAYGIGVGAWDVHAVRWAYSELPAGTDEVAALDGAAAGRTAGMPARCISRPASHAFCGITGRPVGEHCARRGRSTR